MARTLPEYLAPGAAPSGSNPAALRLHELRQGAVLSIVTIRELRDRREIFGKLGSDEQTAAGKELGRDAEEILKTCDALIDALPADPSPPKPSSKSTKDKTLKT